MRGETDYVFDMEWKKPRFDVSKAVCVRVTAIPRSFVTSTLSRYLLLCFWPRERERERERCEARLGSSREPFASPEEESRVRETF